MLPITHGICDQGGAPSTAFSVSLDLRGVFGATSVNPGFSTFSNQPDSTNGLTAVDSHNMPNSGPYTIPITGVTYDFSRAYMLDGTSITVNNPQGGTPWNGNYQGLHPGTFNVVTTIQEGQALNLPGAGVVVTPSAFADPFNSFSLGQPNAKGHGTLSMTFASGTNTPGDGTEMGYLITVNVTEVSTGLQASASQSIVFRNDTGIM